MVDQPTPPFQQLDFVYTPSRDVAADLAYFTQILGGRVVFAVQAMATRVAAIELTSGPPLLLLADHLGGERPILVYRVADLDAALAELEAHGWQAAADLGDPSWAVLLVSQSGRPPDRALSADATRGSHPLRGAPRLLNAEACPLTAPDFGKARAIDVRIGRTARPQPRASSRRRVREPPVQAGQPHGGLRPPSAGQRRRRPSRWPSHADSTSANRPNPVPDGAPGATRITNPASHLKSTRRRR